MFTCVLKFCGVLPDNFRNCIKFTVHVVYLRSYRTVVKKLKALTKQVKTCFEKHILKSAKCLKVLPNIEGFQGTFLKHRSRISQPSTFHIDLAPGIKKLSELRMFAAKGLFS